MSQFLSQMKSRLKLVAARASDALAQAADMVAPTLYESRVAEFHHRWQTVSRFLAAVVSRDLEPAEQRRLLLDSHTRDSLQKMVLLIYAEENALDRLELSLAPLDAGADAAAGRLESPPPQPQPQQPHEPQPRECLEYLLERQILPHLCAAGRRDEPSGIMSLALQFVGALLSRVNYPLLPTREVHESVVGLIDAATRREVEDPVVRKCLLNLLNVLWKKLRADPVQTEFFFLHADRMIARSTNSNSSSRARDSDSSNSPSHSHSHTTDVSELVLFTGLLPHMYAMGKAGDKCREALVIAAAMHEQALCRFILQLTPFCHYAINGVISAFDTLPKTLPVGGGARGLDTELYLLAVRLRFCCTLAMVARCELAGARGDDARTSIANELLLQFRARFCEGPLLDGLLSTSEAAARTATLYARLILEELVACSRDTSANPLLFVYLQFLLQQPPLDAAAAGVASPPTPAQLLPTELLHRMNALSSPLSVVTMDLFTYLVELQDAGVDTQLLGALGDSDRARPRSSSVLSPTSANGAVWFATRFPNSAVASNAHLWKIAAFDGVSDALEIPSAGDSSDGQVLSLLSYIADAEYAACQRAPAAVNDSDTSDDESDADDDALSPLSPTPTTTTSDSDAAVHVDASPPPTTTSRTAATRSAMKSLRDVYLTLNLPSFSPVTPEFRRQSSLSSASSTSFRKQRSLSSGTGDHDNDDSGDNGDNDNDSGDNDNDSGDNDSGDNAASDSDALPLFLRMVFSRLERVLENSFQENLALSGLVAAVAHKPQCAAVVFDVSEARGAGQSVRAILEDVYADALRRIARLPNGDARLRELKKRLVDDDSGATAAAAGDHDAETRLLCGFIVLDEVLKELCSVLFAKERVRSLPLKPEGYYLEPKRAALSPASRRASTDSTFSEASSSGGGLFSPPAGAATTQRSIGKEFEQLLAEAESSIESILQPERDHQSHSHSHSAAAVDAVIDAIAATEFRGE
ncbi:hypothetical protein PybrP1_007253 [[Pythium] brassicae (nom. inval.)]|nr:hypothetical protein PybrP1_007253 [[Pythium] brassicae (nom. inval.)]